jgi:hypothetical protein
MTTMAGWLAARIGLAYIEAQRLAPGREGFGITLYTSGFGTSRLATGILVGGVSQVAGTAAGLRVGAPAALRGWGVLILASQFDQQPQVRPSVAQPAERWADSMLAAPAPGWWTRKVGGCAGSARRSVKCAVKQRCVDRARTFSSTFGALPGTYAGQAVPFPCPAHVCRMLTKGVYWRRPECTQGEAADWHGTHVRPCCR